MQLEADKEAAEDEDEDDEEEEKESEPLSVTSDSTPEGRDEL